MIRESRGARPAAGAAGARHANQPHGSIGGRSLARDRRGAPRNGLFLVCLVFHPLHHRLRAVRGCGRAAGAAVVFGTGLLPSCWPQGDLSAYSEAWSPERGGRAGAGSDGARPAGADAGAGSPLAEGGGGASDGVVSAGDLPLDERTSNGAAADDGSARGDGGVPAPDTASEPCAGGVLGPDAARCYSAVSAAASWQSARDTCSEWRGALVKVETPEEDAFLSSLLAESFWLGGSDLEVDNLYVWTDGTPIFYGNWGFAQPDRFPGPDCVEKRGTPGRFWYDQPCDNARAFVCEKPVTSD